MSVTSSSRSDQIGPDLIPSESDLVRRIDSAKTNDQIEFLLTEINELMKKDSISLDSRQVLRRSRQKVYDRRKKFRDQSEDSKMTGNNLVGFPPISELQQNHQTLLNEVRDLKLILDGLSKAESVTTEAIKSLEVLNGRLGKTEADHVELKESTKVLRSEISDLQADLELLRLQPKGVADIRMEPEHDQTSASKQDFLTGTFSQLGQLNGVDFARHFPLALILMAMAGVIGWFVADQITPLYQAFKFDRPALVAWGSIGMAVGFSGIFGALRSRSAGFMCGLILVYEVLFVVAGTRSHEADQQAAEADAVPEIAFARSELDKARGEYEQKKARYDDPEDKMHQNTWFKSKYVDPAWSTYAEKQSGYSSLRTQYLEDNGGFGLQGLLKLFYRVCAVILLMIVTGLAIRKIRDSIVFQS